ncbi:hypothetical protein A4U53_030625 [Rhizobium ruizarguesonis]|uniref:Uncharacterized protein n=2 Tax=Rhizobium TaxID=379 RepID=A0A179BUL9_RHILE|nr:hypothetical protein [Rhizobium leguminosarum]OAP95065.1 hypothetical protein A4U53_17725 [Rhizobium leguminosarum]
MTSMVERVARVAYEKMGFAYDGRTIMANGRPYGNWATALGIARAAIEAIREPTEAMVLANSDAGGPDDQQTIADWQAMINEALKEETP